MTIGQPGHTQLVCWPGTAWLRRGHVIVALVLLIIMFAEPVADAQVRAASVTGPTDLYARPIYPTASNLLSTLPPAQHLEIARSALHDGAGEMPNVPVHSLLPHDHLGALLLLVCLVAVLFARRTDGMRSRRGPAGFLAPPLAPPKTGTA